MYKNYIVRAFKTAILSGNRYVQLMPILTRKEPAHKHPNVRTESAYRDLETDRICVGQENRFRNESGYDFQKDGPARKNKDTVISEVHSFLVKNKKFSNCDIVSRTDLVKVYDGIEHKLVTNRQTKIPSTAKPLF